MAQPREDKSLTARMKERFMEEPLIPVGLVAVVAVLTRGIMAFQSGDSKTSYRMMRYRVLFQGGVACLLLFGVLIRPSQVKDPSEGKIYTVDKDFFLSHAKEYHVSSEDAARRSNAMGAAMIGTVDPSPNERN